MARRDHRYIQAYKASIVSVGSELGIEPAVIAGIISRESRGGTAITASDGWGDNRNAFGLMQVSGKNKNQSLNRIFELTQL